MFQNHTHNQAPTIGGAIAGTRDAGPTARRSASARPSAAAGAAAAWSAGARSAP